MRERSADVAIKMVEVCKSTLRVKYRQMTYISVNITRGGDWLIFKLFLEA